MHCLINLEAVEYDRFHFKRSLLILLEMLFVYSYVYYMFYPILNVLL